MPVNEIIDSIQNIDEKVLNEERIEGLLRFIPTTEEIEIVMEYQVQIVFFFIFIFVLRFLQGNVLSMGQSEQFFRYVFIFN
jgi:hypothetical protein